MTEKIKLGIIGGKGQMGRFLASALEGAFQSVEVSDKETKLSNKDIINNNDIVIISVPISSTVAVINEVIEETREEQLLVDVTSLKVEPLTAMLKSKSEVLGLHPMFGPQQATLSGQVILVCQARPKTYTKFFLDSLAQRGAILKDTTGPVHDKMMAVIQGLNHFNALITGTTLSKLGVDFEESLEYASAVYKIRMDLIARIFAQDPGLYADIAIENPHTVEALEQFIKCGQELLEIIKKKDKAGYIKVFEAVSDYFASYKEKGLRSSNKLIECVLGKK